MAKKMTLSDYLAQRGTKAKALTRGEATLLGIPYPLQAGWPRRYGAVQIDDGLFEQLAACAEAARRAAEEKAKRVQACAAGKPVVAPRPPQTASAPVAPKVVFGFVVRKARRYCSRRPAPCA